MNAYIITYPDGVKVVAFAHHHSQAKSLAWQYRQVGNYHQLKVKKSNDLTLFSRADKEMLNKGKPHLGGLL